jgi:hypothetical protein
MSNDSWELQAEEWALAEDFEVPESPSPWAGQRPDEMTRRAEAAEGLISELRKAWTEETSYLALERRLFR